MTQHTDNTVNQENILDINSLQTVFNCINTAKRPLTKAEIQTETALSIFNVEDAIYTLLEQYPCTLEVNEKGQIIYKFKLLQKRNANTFKDSLHKIAGFIKHLFVFIFKLLITLVFFSYSLTAGVAIALIIAILAKSPQPIAVLFIALFEAIKMMFIDIQSFFNNKPQAQTSNEKNLIAMVFGYAFGVSHPIDTLSVEKHILKYIQLNNCIVTATDLSMICGWDINKCNDELTLMLTAYRGKVEVSDEGVIYYSFPEFEPIKNSEQEQKSSLFIWNNLHKEQPYNNNKKSENSTIKGITIFSLVVSLITIVVFNSIYNIQASDLFYVLTFAAEQNLGLPHNVSINISIALYLLLFFVFFLIAASIAKNKNIRQNALLKKQNSFYKNLKIVFAHLPNITTDLFSYTTEKDLFNLSYALKGELNINEQNAKTYYNFAYLDTEMKAASRLRGGVPYPPIVDASYKSGVTSTSKKTEQKSRTKKKKSLSIRKIIFLLLTIIVVASIYFYNDVRTIILTNNPDKYEADNIVADHSSLLFSFYKLENYTHFKKLYFKNLTKERNIPQLVSPSPIELLDIQSAQCDVLLPEKMLELHTLKLHDIKGNIVLPKHLNNITTIDFRNTNCEINFPDTMGYCGLLKIADNNMKKVFLPKRLMQLEEIHIEKATIDSSFINTIRAFGLEKIVVINNQQKWFPDSMQRVTKLNELILYNNQLTKIPGGLDQLERLYTLDLSGNSIKTLPDSLKLRVSATVRLGRNKIVQLPPSFWSYGCHELYLDSNMVRQLPEADSSTAISIGTLSLSSNKLKHFPQNTSAMKNHLLELDLSHNSFKDFPVQLCNLAILNELKIGHNNIKALPPEIGNMTKLMYLYINGNPLKVVPNTLSNLKKNTYPCRFYIDKDWNKELIQDIKKQVGSDNVYHR